MFQNSMHIFNDPLPSEEVSVPIKKEKYEDNENLFNCQVELIEEGTHYVVKPEINHEFTNDQNYNAPELNHEVPKIQLKTVDEINRKCIVSNYIDIVKKRRQEVNRRYYLKRKEQKKKQRMAVEQIAEESHITTKEKNLQCQSETYSNEFAFENVIQHEEPKFCKEDYMQPIKSKEDIPVPKNVQFSGYDSYANFTEEYKAEEEYQNYTVSGEESLSVSDRYLRDSKIMRREINRRYYLKRKRKMQLEKGITERVIVKNDAYLRRRERNRRYYLKRKQKMNQEGQEMNDSSNSQSSIPLNDSTFSSHISTDREETSFYEGSGRMSESNSDYTCTSNELLSNNLEIKREDDFKIEIQQDQLELTHNGFYNETVESWVKSQNRLENTETYQMQSELNMYNCTPSAEAYLEEAARKRQERNRRYYLKHREKLKQQRLEKCKSVTK